MRSSILPLALILAGSVAAAAQQPAPAQQPAQLTRQASSISLYNLPQAHACSVADMRATQGSSSQMLKTGKGPSVPMMRPSLTLTPRDGRPIASATVTAHGYSAKGGSMDLVAQAVPDGRPRFKPDMARTIEVKFHPAADGGFTAELQLPGFSAVTMIDLNSVTYSDGSTWRVATKKDCRVEPDPLLLIAEH